ncbi:MAG: cytochrome P450 [Acidimicrobiales bacterium]
MSTTLTPRRVEDLRPRVQHIVNDLIAAIAQAGQPADLISDYAAQLSIAVLSELLGIPIADRDGFRAWSNAMMAVFSAPTPEEMAQAGERLPAFIAELIAAQRSKPDNNLLSALIAAGSGLGDTQLQNVVLTLLLAGYVPPANAMSLAVLQLLRHPDQLEALRAKPALITTAVDELLRIDQGSTTDQLRIATAEVEIGGVLIHSGEVVVAPLRCANRDPDLFADPDRFDITRAENSQLVFAHGPHHCLGTALARLELQIGIGTLVASFPQLRLAVPFAELHWRTLFFTLNGPQGLPVAW